MKILFVCAAMAGVAGMAQAQPVVVEESSRISAPAGVDYIGGQTALDGNDAVVQGSQSVPDGEGGRDDTIASAYLFHCNGNTWTFVRKLAEGFDDNEDDAGTKYPV